MLVHKDVRDTLVSRLLEKISRVKLGDSLSAEMLSYEGPCMGPVVNDAQFNKVWSFIDEAKAEGLTVVCGGERLQREGYFIPPTVFVDVPTTAKVWNEEIFGPVLCIRVRRVE